jgi:hypothetical protein
MTKPTLRVANVVLAAALVLAACAQAPEESGEPVARRVENAELGVAIAGLPAAFEVVASEGPAIELALAEGEGRLEITAGEPGSSVNLVAAVERHKARIEGLPGGDYKGGQELVVPSLPGAAYYSRGRYQGAAGAVVEETAVFLLHPEKDRELRVLYTYPAGDDSADRLQNQLFAVVGELEGLPGVGEEPPPDSGAAPP